MLSSKARILWIKLHAYLACFFLPFALLYALTGLLYLFDFQGSEITLQSVFVESKKPLPESESAALALYESFRKLHPQLPSERPDNFWQDDHLVSWWHFRGEVLLKPAINEHGRAGFNVIVEDYDFLKQLHFIHKGLAGGFFKLLGILMGLSLLFSIISGAVVALAMPKLRLWSIRSAIAGSVILIAGYCSN